MKRTIALSALLVAGVISSVGSAFAATVATVNGVAISDSQVTHAVQQSGLPDTADLRNAMKNRLIALELFRQEATKSNITTRPGVKQVAGEARDAAAVQLYLREAIKPNSITEMQVRVRYDAIVASLGEQEYKPWLILAADDATAQSILGQLKSGADFAALATQFSKVASAAKGGELDWVSFKLPLTNGTTQGYPLALAEAIVKLPAGAVSPAPIVVGNQRYLVKVEAVRPTVVPAYEQVAPAIKAALERNELERATAQLVAGLIKIATIER